MSDPTGAVPVEGAAPETAAAPSGPDFSPVMSRVDELAGTVGQLAESFQGWQQSQQTPPEPEADPWAALIAGETDPNVDVYGNPIPPQAQAIDPAALRQAYQTDLQAATAPLQQQLQQMQAAQAREQLFQEIPAFRDPAVAQAHVDSMVQQMQAANMPVEYIQQALSNPHTIAIYFKAAEAEKLAAGQAPAGEQVPNVESAGGAVPGGNGAPVNPVHAAYGNQPQGLAKGFN